MSDYSLKVTLRNARILDAIREAGYRSARQFAKRNGIHENVLNGLIGFRQQVVGKDGRLSKAAQDLCDTLCALPEDLWTDEQLWAKLPRNTWTFDLSQEEAQALADSRPIEEWLDLAQAPRLLEKLGDRERAVINAVVITDQADSTQRASQDARRGSSVGLVSLNFRFLRQSGEPVGPPAGLGSIPS